MNKSLSQNNSKKASLDSQSFKNDLQFPWRNKMSPNVCSIRLQDKVRPACSLILKMQWFSTLECVVFYMKIFRMTDLTQSPGRLLQKETTQIDMVVVSSILLRIWCVETLNVLDNRQVCPINNINETFSLKSYKHFRLLASNPSSRFKIHLIWFVR